MTTQLISAPAPTPVSMQRKRDLLAELLRQKARERVSVAPLSYGQKALWFLYRTAPDSAAYHVSFSARICSTVDTDALRRAFQKLVDRHSALRATFALQDGEPVQTIAGHRDVCLEISDCKGLSDEALYEHVKAGYQRPFQLDTEPGFRALLASRAPDEHVLLVTVHHIVYDAWSLWLNIDEIGQLYAAEVSGKALTRPLLQYSYPDYVRRQQEMLAGADGERLWKFWQSELAGDLPLLALPTDRPRPPVQTYNGASYRFALEPAVAQQIKKLAQEEGVTPFMLQLAAFQVLLYRYTGQEDILIGSPTSGRGDARFSDVVGYFVNPVVLRANLGGNPTFTNFLKTVFKTVVNALEHQDFPFPLLVERLQPRRDPSYAPLFQTSFVYQKPQQGGAATDWLGLSGTAGGRSKWGGLDMEFFDLPQQEGQFDLELEVLEQETTFSCVFKYNTDLFEVESIARLARNFAALLDGIAAAPQTPVDRLPILDAGERRRILVDWNATAVEYPRYVGVHQIIEQQVGDTPLATALVFGEQRLSYAEFNESANQLAHCLVAAGVRPGSVVGVCLERSIDMVVALHAIVKAGGAYLPLDPEYPSDRIQYMAGDAGIKLLLTHSALLDRFTLQGVHVLALDTEYLRIGRFPKHNPDAPVKTDDIAYVIYTSGSTGKPKGVAVPHRGLLNRLQWMQAQYSLDANDSVLQKTPYSFDVSVWEFFWPLMTGASLVVAAPGEHRDSRRLVELINQHGITTLHFVPSMLRAFLNDPQAASCESLRRVICSGEALPFDLQQLCFATLKEAELYNLYGPTEASIDVSHWTCRRDGVDTIVPIGIPIANTALHILDGALNPVPIGVAGELHIGGVGLARGYLNKPELTAEKFIRNPFSDAADSRLYKTGDLARYRVDGSIEYLGRLDFQVKIRGFRIELGEIEAVLAQCPGVKACVVVAREENSDKRLVAYVVAYGEALQAAALREALLERLPEHMVPSVFVMLDELPLNSNGKVDRRALPKPEAGRSDRSVFIPPRDAVEHAVVKHWEAVLNVQPIGVRDNFFELGGHSLLAVNLMTRIEKEFGKTLPMALLFRKPTVEQLAEVLREQVTLPAPSPLVPIQTAGTGTPFFCVAGGGGSVLYYYPLAQHMGADRPFYGLQAPGLDGECEPLSRVEEMAATYIDALRAVQPHGPYFLGGHCFGGLVAFEMAQQLRMQGETVAQLVLMDVPAQRPQNHPELLRADDSVWIVKLAGVMKESSGVDLGITTEGLSNLDAMAQLSLLKERMQSAGFLPPGADIAKVRGLLRVFAANNTAHYEPRTLQPIPITLFRAGEFHADYDFSAADDVGCSIENSTMGWGAYARGNVAVQVVAGNHITMMSEPQIAQLGVLVKQSLLTAEQQASHQTEHRMEEMGTPTFTSQLVRSLDAADVDGAVVLHAKEVSLGLESAAN